MINEIECFKWQCSKKVDDEPSLQIVHGNHFLLGDNSARLFVNVSSAKVDDNIDNEEDFDNAVCYD